MRNVFLFLFTVSLFAACEESQPVQSGGATDGAFLPSGLTSGLDVYLPFNGNADDLSGNTNDGIVLEGTTLTSDRFGVPNSAYSFSGINSGIVVNCRVRQRVTFAAWFRTSTPPVAGPMFHILDTYGAGGPAILPSGKLEFTLEVGVANYSPRQTTMSVTDGLWHFMAITYDGDTLAYYLDNQQVAVIGVSGSIDYDGSGYQDFWVGRHWLWEGESLIGDIDDVRIYRRALSKEEISLLFNQ